MFMKMKNLQIKADDIWNLTGISLDKQQEVIDGQSTALEGLQNLTKLQSEALEDSRYNRKLNDKLNLNQDYQ